MAKFPKLPKGATKWEPEDQTPAVLRSSRALEAPLPMPNSIYDRAELSEARARYWLSMDGWTAKESALLLCAIDPGLIELLEARPGGGKLLSELGWPLHLDDLHRLIGRAVEVGMLATLSPPAEVIRWADRKDLRMPASFVAELPHTRRALASSRRLPISREAANRSAILACLVADGIDPKALPASPSGRPHEAKQRARDALAKLKPPISQEAFKKAWQALRDSGEIADA